MVIQIKDYYKQTASQSLNMALFSLLLSIGLFFVNYYFFQKQYIWTTVIPFLLLSILFFFLFRLNMDRFRHVPDTIRTSQNGPLAERNVLLLFMPAPAIRVLLFNSEGLMVGELSEEKNVWYKWLIPGSMSALMPATYVLSNQEQKILGRFRNHKWLSDEWTIESGDGVHLYTYKEERAKSLLRYKGVIMTPDHTAVMDVDIGGFLQQFSIPYSGSKKDVATFQKGWMPVEWAKRFKELNTPILSFSDQATEGERMAVYGLCIRLLRNYNH